MSDREAAMELYKRQRDRTAVVSLPREGGIYRRSDIIDLVDGTVGKHAISAIGQLENNLKWEIVFNFVDNKESFLDHAQHLVKGRQVSAESLRRGPRRLRILRVPMCVPNGFISSLLAKHRVKVTRIDYERNLQDGLTSNVRIATVEASDWDLVPDTLPWSFDGLKGTALIFLQGRSPRCHRCQERGHKFFECDRPYCRRCRRVGHEESEACNRRTYAQTAGREQEVDQDDMDLHYDDENATRETTHRATTEMQQQQQQPVDWFEQTEPPTATESTAVQQRDETVAPVPTMTETTAAVAEIEAVSTVTEIEPDATASTASTAKEPATVNATAATETEMLQSDISDHDDHDGDGDGESTASSGDGFKKPRSRCRSKKRSAVSGFTSSDAAPTKLKAPRSATERKMATRPQQETTVLDPTIGRRHSRTRVTTGRRLSAGDIAIDQ